MLETACDILRDAYTRNWITARDGNISIRHHDRDYFYITPSGVRKQTMQPEMFKRINILKNTPEYSFEMDNAIKYGYEVLPQEGLGASLKPSGELPLHFGLQKEMGQHQNDVRVVVHVHPTYTIAAIQAGILLPELCKDFPELSRYTRVAPSVGDVPPISQELADECHKNLGLDHAGNLQYDIVGIKGHGVVSISTTPWRAYEHIERLEHICRIVLASGVCRCKVAKLT